jgi:hypothetical protein
MTSSPGGAHQGLSPDAWASVAARLTEDGYAVLENLITPEQCVALSAMYPEKQHFRSRIVMARHGFGAGEYQYFAYPLPALLAQLRAQLYAGLTGGEFVMVEQRPRMQSRPIVLPLRKGDAALICTAHGHCTAPGLLPGHHEACDQPRPFRHPRQRRASI